jgi:hypothetical protein
MTTNRVVFEMIYRVVGLQSYLPYLLPMIVVHIGASTVLWLVCRRADIRPWIATVTATLFLFFGAGAEVLGWADPFGYVSPLLFGTIQLLLTDHDGPIDPRRDLLGLLAGFVGVMSGGPALVMIAVVGMSLCLRRRWAAAALATLPLAAAWFTWWLLIGREYDLELAGRETAGQVAPYFITGVTSSVDAVSRLGISGVLVVALVLLVALLPHELVRRGRAPVLALALGFVLFWAQAAIGRVKLGPEQAASSRYLYLAAFLILPLIAFGIDQVGRRVPRLLPGFLVLGIWALVSNLSLLYDWNRHWSPIEAAMERAVAASVSLPGIDAVDPSTRLDDPDGVFEGVWLAPIGVLRALDANGDFPDWQPVSESDRLRWASVLLVRAEPAVSEGPWDAEIEGSSDVDLREDAAGCLIATPTGENPGLRFERGLTSFVSTMPAGGELVVQLVGDTPETRSPAKAVGLAPDVASRVIIGLDDVEADLRLPATGSTRFCSG